LFFFQKFLKRKNFLHRCETFGFGTAKHKPSAVPTKPATMKFKESNPVRFEPPVQKPKDVIVVFSLSTHTACIQQLNANPRKHPKGPTTSTKAF